jgi:hypothetical protein
MALLLFNAAVLAIAQNWHGGDMTALSCTALGVLFLCTCLPKVYSWRHDGFFVGPGGIRRKDGVKEAAVTWDQIADVGVLQIESPARGQDTGSGPVGIEIVVAFNLAQPANPLTHHIFALAPGLPYTHGLSLGLPTLVPGDPLVDQATNEAAAALTRFAGPKFRGVGRDTGDCKA